MKKHNCLKAVLIAFATMFIAGCSKNNDKTLILWTDNVVCFIRGIVQC